MRIAVVGGTGTAGRVLAAQARSAGHDVVTVSRHPSSEPGHVAADLITGSGLDLALAGAEAVVDVSNIATGREAKAKEFFTIATEQLLAAEQRTAVRHHLAVSIVGVDRMPSGYYRAKLAQEQAVMSVGDRTGVGYTIARVTQFHDFAALVLRQYRLGRVVVAPPLHLQPVHLRDVATHLLQALQNGPAGRAPDLGGPRAEELPDMVRRYAAAVGVRARVVVPPLVGAARRADEERVLRPTAGAVRGTLSFDHWLAEVLPGSHPR